MEQNYNPYTNPPEGGFHNHPQMNDIPPLQHNTIKPNYFEIFAFIFAIGSLISTTIIYMSYACAGLSILFALLSRGAQMNFSSRAKLSIFLSVGSIVASTFLFVMSFLYLLQEYGSLEGILRESCETLGIDFEKEFGNFFNK